MKIAAGAIWKIEHARKGPLTIRLLNDLDTEQETDDFFKAEIVEGIERIASREREPAIPGDTLAMRTRFVRFLASVSPPSQESSTSGAADGARPAP